MKFTKLIKKLNNLFDPQMRDQKSRRKDTKAALKKIRDKQHELEQRLKECSSDLEAKELQEKISILMAQRAKGLEFLKETKKKED